MRTLFSVSVRSVGERSGINNLSSSSSSSSSSTTTTTTSGIEKQPPLPILAGGTCALPPQTMEHELRWGLSHISGTRPYLAEVDEFVMQQMPVATSSSSSSSSSSRRQFLVLTDKGVMILYKERNYNCTYIFCFFIFLSLFSIF